eukprot:6795578-Pyramimonas_sp.AAC.1
MVRRDFVPTAGTCSRGCVKEVGMVCGAACPAFLRSARASALIWSAPFTSMERPGGTARLGRRRRMPSWSVWGRARRRCGVSAVAWVRRLTMWP